ncbi:hypothetical protein [Chakrabartyella piscis]|uniref:FMN-binding protein n=1 Tax=Chakrabartyella piscis TaxID=2918914 RepID=UPI00295859AA|nr:hypothetical protein [Chakrabartyella piscis]
MAGSKFMVIKLKELIRTAIFAILGVVILVGLIWFFLGIGDKDTAMYRDGVYHTQVTLGEEKAMVSVTIEEGLIADVALSELTETATVFYPLMESAAEEVCREVVKTQSLEISVSKANAYSAQEVLQAVAQGLEQAKN